MTWLCERCGSDNPDIEPDCISCKEAQKPFYRKHLKKEGEDKLLMTLRLNAEERALLDEIKATLDLNNDGGALKLAAFHGWNVLRRTLGADTLKWLSSKDRQSRGPK